MFDLALRFDSLQNLCIFLLAFAVCTCGAYMRLSNKLSVRLAPVIFLNFLLLTAWTMLFELDHDMVAHLHLSWLVSQGFIPYKDFWQHHPPFFWALLAPLQKYFPHSVAVFDLGRFFSGMVFLVNAWMGWRIAKHAWQEKAKIGMYLLVLSGGALVAEYTFLKPDIFMIFFLLAGVLLSFEVPGKRVSPSFFAGISCALAASFIVKQYLVYLLPVCAVFLGAKKPRAVKLIAYVAGFAVGLVPLGCYLACNHIVNDFFFWVFGFNKRIVLFTIFFPVCISFLGVWGALLLRKRFAGSGHAAALLMCIAFFLSMLSTTTSVLNVNGGHYLGFFIFMAAICASGCDVYKVMAKIPSLGKRSLAWGLVLSMFIAPNVAIAWRARRGDFARDKKMVQQLMEYSRHDSCVAFLPIHPVYARDAVRIYSDWQFRNIELFSDLMDDARKHDTVRQITALRPSVVACRFRGRDLLFDLYLKKVITADGFKQLHAFLKDNYTEKFIVKDSFYIRNDLLAKKP